MIPQASRRAVLLVAWCAVGAVAEAAEDTHQLSYNHFEQNRSLSFTVDAAPDDTIAMDILDTCPSEFSFEVKGIERTPEPDRTRALEGCPAATKKMSWKHERRYGGYLLMITAPSPVAVRKEGADPPVKTLESVVLVIHVRPTGWALEVGGGFTIDGLVSPRYALATRTVNGADASFVVRDPDSDDAASLGLATFIHAYHHRLPPVALSFGLGLSESSHATYYTGLSLRLSSKATLTGGVAWGSVERLPTGVTTAMAVTDPNILNELPTRVSAKPFFALSYGFLGSRDRLSKPFAGTPESK